MVATDTRIPCLMCHPLSVPEGDRPTVRLPTRGSGTHRAGLERCLAFLAAHDGTTRATSDSQCSDAWLDVRHNRTRCEHRSRPWCCSMVAIATPGTCEPAGRPPAMGHARPGDMATPDDRNHLSIGGSHSHCTAVHQPSGPSEQAADHLTCPQCPSFRLARSVSSVVTQNGADEQPAMTWTIGSVPDWLRPSAQSLRRIPLCPRAWGTLLNVVLFGLLAWMGVETTAAWIRVRRRRAGLCPMCRYPSAAGVGCSECGWRAIRR